MTKRYKIVITEFTQETEIRGKEWAKVNDIPDTNYEYTPEIEKVVNVQREVLVQNVEKLNLIEVIKAINGIRENENK